MAATRDRVHVVLVNWNGWRDTIECLDSVFKSHQYASFRVTVCDNASTDGSIESIQSWAVAKGIPHRVLSRVEAEQATDREDDALLLTLVAIDANLGFAGGCNVGLRHALRQPSCGFVWLLNNDTVVDPGAMAALVHRLQAKPAAGQCGSRILSYAEPNVVQALGGERYNRWFASSTPIGVGRPADEPVDTNAVEREMSYVAGAALCVTRQFVEAVGLLDESYFLYGEELDWLARARGRFALAYAHDSIVYHKEGRTIGSSRNGGSRSALSDFYMVRSRLRFTWKHERVAFPTVVLGVLVAGINRIRRRQLDRALAILRILFSPGTYAAAPTRVPPEPLP